MTSANYNFHRRCTNQLLIDARREIIRECCRSHPLDLNPDFYRHSGKEYAAISYGATKLEVNIGSGAWSSTTGCSSRDSVVLGPGAGVITGTKENFLLVLADVFS